MFLSERKHLTWDRSVGASLIWEWLGKEAALCRALALGQERPWDLRNREKAHVTMWTLGL